MRSLCLGLLDACIQSTSSAFTLLSTISWLGEDQEAASINMGYHLVFYGDQAQELGYYDQGGEQCDGTLQALFRRLSHERYKNGWSLDILTLKTLLEQRGVAVLDPFKEHLLSLKAGLEQISQEQKDLVPQEIERLQQIIQERA